MTLFEETANLFRPQSGRRSSRLFLPDNTEQPCSLSLVKWDFPVSLCGVHREVTRRVSQPCPGFFNSQAETLDHWTALPIVLSTLCSLSLWGQRCWGPLGSCWVPQGTSHLLLVETQSSRPQIETHRGHGGLCGLVALLDPWQLSVINEQTV